MAATSGSFNFDSTFLDTFSTSDYFLDKGAYGTVYGPIPWHELQLAIKQVMFANGKVTDEIRDRIETKREIWKSLKHRHLMRIHSVDLNRLPKVMFFVMDFAAGGSLHSVLRSLEDGHKMPIHVVTDWAKQIAKGMLYLHDKQIVHRDLKSANILLMEPFDIHTYQTKTITLKITDFDDIKEHYYTTNMSTLVGTCTYMAPEVLINERFSKASDVWSYGVVIWEMLSGDIPHKGLEQRALISKASRGELGNLPLALSFPEDFKLLLNKCWESDYIERPSFFTVYRILESKDEPPKKYASDPFLVSIIGENALEKKNNSMERLTILDKELFVVCSNDKHSEIEVYDTMEFNLIRRWKLTEILFAWDITSCRRNKCLYVFDYRGFRGTSNGIFRFDIKGNIIKKWSTGDDFGFLSVTDESNVILTVSSKNKLNEYSPDGQLIREINLSSDGDIRFPRRAVKLTNGHFVVSHGDNGADPYGVSKLDADGNLIKSFNGKIAPTVGELNLPVSFCVDGSGFVLVADRSSRRIFVLDSNLEFKREMLCQGTHGLRFPAKIILDETNNRMIVVDNAWCYQGQILIYQFST